MKNIIYSVIAGLVGAALLMGGVALFSDEPAVGTDVDVVDGVDGKDGEKGDQGPRGWAGPAGPAGPAGADGADGVDGADATELDIDDLADAVVDELEDREDAIEIGFRGNGGNHTRSFSIEDADSYEFSIRHFGSGDFIVSLEDEDGGIETLVDVEGHYNGDIGKYLRSEDWILHISADASWRIEITQD